MSTDIRPRASTATGLYAAAPRPPRGYVMSSTSKLTDSGTTSWIS